VQIFKALVNSKIFLLHFRPGYPYRPTQPLVQPDPLLPQAEANFAGPSRSAHARRWLICKNMFSSLIHAIRSRCLLSIHPLTYGPHLSVSSSPPHRPTPAVSPPCRRSPRRLLHASAVAEPLPPPISPPLNLRQVNYGPPVSSIPFLTPADYCHFSSSPLATPRRHAARPPTSRCQARSSLNALIPPPNSPP
jgi:hypothetical protein